MGTHMVLEMSTIFNEMTEFTAQLDFINSHEVEINCEKGLKYSFTYYTSKPP
jgi:hypothetical protein